MMTGVATGSGEREAVGVRRLIKLTITCVPSRRCSTYTTLGQHSTRTPSPLLATYGSTRVYVGTPSSELVQSGSQASRNSWSTSKGGFVETSSLIFADNCLQTRIVTNLDATGLPEDRKHRSCRVRSCRSECFEIAATRCGASGECSDGSLLLRLLVPRRTTRPAARWSPSPPIDASHRSTGARSGTVRSRENAGSRAGRDVVVRCRYERR
jgi:hypothetical protein